MNLQMIQNKIEEISEELQSIRSKIFELEEKENQLYRQKEKLEKILDTYKCRIETELETSWNEMLIFSNLTGIEIRWKLIEMYPDVELEEIWSLR